MTDLLTFFLGVDTDGVPDGAKTRLEWAQGPASGEGMLLLILLFAGVIGLIVWNYRREGSASPARKAFLAGLRLTALLLIVAMALEPRLAVDLERTTPARTVVVIDESLSMSIKDRYEGSDIRGALIAAAGLADGTALAGATRADLVERVLARTELLPTLDATNPVRLYAFAEGVRRIDGSGDGGEGTDEGADGGEGEGESKLIAVPDIVPRGQATDLARALRASLEEAGSDVLAAVVVITDGRRNRGEDPIAAADALRKRGVPVYAIGVGDPAEPRNLAVLELGAPPRVYKGDPMLVEARVRVRGFEGLSLPGGPLEVELLRNDQVLETRPVDAESETVRFRVTNDDPGEYVFTARIAVRPGELSEDDNQRSTRVEVVDEKARVLVIAGSPSLEYRTLRTLLRRDRTIETSIWLQSADDDLATFGSDKPIDHIPSEREELFEYDAVLLFDPDPEGLPISFPEELRKLVLERGSGVMLVAGNKFTVKLFESPDMGPLRTVLPVEPDIERASTMVGGGQTFVETWPLNLTDDGAEHPITRLGTNTGIVLQAWKRLPGVRWHFPVLREKPGASVLLRHSDPTLAAGADGEGAPLLSATHYGPGRTLFAAIDETWRWRSVARALYERFWVQAVRFIVEGRLLGGRGRVTVALDREVCNLGEAVAVRATVLDESYQPHVAATVEAEVVRAGAADPAEPLTLRAVAGVPGRYEATFVPPRAGLYDVVVTPPGTGGVSSGDETWKPGRASVRVEPPDFEFADPRLDRATLEGVAAHTGGSYIPLERAGELPALIPALRETIVVSGNPVPLWDSPIVVILLVIVLGIEWWVRKRSKMV